MKIIVSFSGGKDSTAMLLRMIELNMPIDKILYFDCGSWEFSQMAKHIDKVEAYIEREITRIQPKVSFDELFLKYNFPQYRGRWCTSVKVNSLLKGNRQAICYMGYSCNEGERAERLLKVRDSYKALEFPLIKWGWSELDCLRYCYQKGFTWDGLYQYFNRVSCWCCPFQGLSALRNLRKHFPDLWKRLLEMEKISKNTFRPNASVFDLERRFALEDEQLLKEGK